MASIAAEPVRFRFRNSRARPGLRVVDMMRAGRTVATIHPTDDGLRLVSHEGRTWTKPRWSAKHPTAVDVAFAPDER